MGRVETDQERIRFNELWWSDVQEGEVISQDEIEEVRWLVSEVKRLRGEN